MSALTSPSGLVTTAGGIRVVVASFVARRLTQAVAPMTAQNSSTRRSFPFLQLARQLRDSFLDRSRVVHGAELRPAHPAELGALEVLGRERLVVVLLRAIRVQAQAELLLPVESNA